MKTLANNGNVIPFPGTQHTVSASSQMIVRPQWMTDDSEIATVQIRNNSYSHMGLMEGDTLVVKMRFRQSEVRFGALVVATLPDGRTVLRRVGFGPSQIRIDGIVMEFNRSLALAA